MPQGAIGEGIGESTNWVRDLNSTIEGAENPGSNDLTNGGGRINIWASAHGFLCILLALTKGCFSERALWRSSVALYLAFLPWEAHSPVGAPGAPTNMEVIIKRCSAGEKWATE